MRAHFAEATSNGGVLNPGYVEEALEAYHQALAANPRLASAHYNAARVYAQLDDLESCLGHMDSLLALSPEMAEDAAQDEHLRWALRMREMRDTRGPGEGTNSAG